MLLPASRGTLLLRFCIVASNAAKSVFACGLLGSLLVNCCHANQPNVLLIFGEDHGVQMGAYGTAGIETPNLDALAAQGVLFEKAYVTLPTCSASKASIMTGLFNHTTGALHNVQEFVGSAEELQQANPSWLNDPNSSYNKLRIDPQFPTLVEKFSAAGYYTGTQNKFHLSNHESFPYDHWSTGNNAGKVDNFINEAQAADKPWLLVHHVKHTHRPFPTNVTVDPYAVELPAHLPDTPVARQDWAEYMSSVEKADQQVGDVIKKLERSGDADNTIIVYVGDHGPAYHRGKLTTYNFGLHVPLLISGPGIQQGVTTAEKVSTVDLMPTLLDFANIAEPALQHGTSQRNLLEGDPTFQGRDYLVGMVKSDRSITDGRYQLIWMPNANDTAMPPDHTDIPIWGNPVYGDIVANKNDPAYAEAYRFLDLADKDLPEYNRPEFEFYDLETDRWEVNDFSTLSQYAPHQNRLKVALQLWGHEHADPDVDLFRITPTVASHAGPVDVVDRFDGNRGGPLDNDSQWRTRLSGVGGEDFQIDSANEEVDAPRGYKAVATYEDAVRGTNDDFLVTVDTEFDRPGVGAGLVFGYVDEDNFFEFQLLDGRTAAEGIDKDVRLVHRSSGVDNLLLFENALPNYQGGLYGLSAAYTAATSTLDLSITDNNSQHYFTQSLQLASPLAGNSLFGISSYLSNHAKFDNFHVSIPDFTIKRGRMDQFTARAGPLHADARWSTRIPGVNGEDFVIEPTAEYVDAPRGYRALATYDKETLHANEDFSVAIKTLFDRPGVGAGLVFGFTDVDNFFEFQLLDGRTSAQGLDKDVRLVQMSDGIESVLFFDSSLPNYNGGWYQLSADYSVLDQLLDLQILDDQGEIYFTHSLLLDERIAGESLFGISSYLSNHAKFDEFKVDIFTREVSDGKLLGDFNADEVLDNQDLDLLLAAFGPSTPETAQFNLTMPDEMIDEADLDFWMQEIFPLVTAGGEVSALIAGDSVLPGDLTRWSDEYGNSNLVAWEEGDFDGNRIVDGADFLLLQTHSASGLPFSQIIPEPSSLSLLLLMASGFARRSPRKV